MKNREVGERICNGTLQGRSTKDKPEERRQKGKKTKLMRKKGVNGRKYEEEEAK